MSKRGGSCGAGCPDCGREKAVWSHVAQRPNLHCTCVCCSCSNSWNLKMTDMSWICYEMSSSFLSWVERWWNLLMLKVLTSENTRNHSLFWLPDTRYTYTKLSFHFFLLFWREIKVSKEEHVYRLILYPWEGQSLYMVDKPENSWWYKQKNQRSPSSKYLWILGKKHPSHINTVFVISRESCIFTFWIILRRTRTV